jgi:glutaredoxin
MIMSTAIFYHAGCPVCLGAEQMVAEAIDRSKYQVEVVHLGEHAGRIAEAERAGVKSVPALVLNDRVFHINFGASIDGLK